MAVLVPADFPMTELANDAERRVVEALRDGLSDSWFVLPDVAFRSDRDHQLDVVLLHEGFGIIDVEVKGHHMSVRDGLWCDRGGPLHPQPPAQARANAYALRELLRAIDGVSPHQQVDWAVALPNTTELSGHLPPEVRREQLILGPDLEDPEEALEALVFSSSFNRRLGEGVVEQIVATLRPDCEFSWDPNARAASARERLDLRGAEQVKALETLDANRRVVVSGAAGTGKTRLAVAWTRRAYSRGERVWLTCYNEPLAAHLTGLLPNDEAIKIGAFLTSALALPGMRRLDVPDGADNEWWSTAAVGHLHRHWPEVEVRFDTIVVDEAQDLSPAWLAQLAALLDPDGPRRMLLLVDEAQSLYRRGFTAPSPDDGWVHASLVNNCRNALEIARLLRRRLNGAPAPLGAPNALGLVWREATDLDEIVAAVGAELERLRAEDRDPDGIAVITTSSRSRDQLRGSLALRAWDAPGPAVACETVHRAKGLEVDTVVLVADRPDVDDALLYVGVARAVAELVVIGPRAVADRLGMSAP